MVQIQYFINIVDCVGCFKFTSEITLIVILFAHYFYKMFYIFGCAKIRHHDIIDVFKTEYITSKFDTFSVMVGNTINTKRAITYTDSFASTDDKSVISWEYFCAFYDRSVSWFFSNYCCHLPIIEYDDIAHLHNLDDLRETDTEFSWCTKSLFWGRWCVSYLEFFS